jgi:hypothetical protein
MFGCDLDCADQAQKASLGRPIAVFATAIQAYRPEKRASWKLDWLSPPRRGNYTRWPLQDRLSESVFHDFRFPLGLAYLISAVTGPLPIATS